MSTISIPAGSEPEALVISTGSGGVNRILVVSEGTTDLVFYDNASEASGVVIALVPASTPAGTFLDGLSAANGITVSISAGTPSITVDYTMSSSRNGGFV